MAATHATKEAIWLRRFMAELDVQQQHATVIYDDNQGAIAITKNPIHHDRTKHIDVQYHFVREQVEANTVTLKYLPTQQMPADILTKPIPRDAHVRHVKTLGLKEGRAWKPVN